MSILNTTSNSDFMTVGHCGKVTASTRIWDGGAYKFHHDDCMGMLEAAVSRLSIEDFSPDNVSAIYRALMKDGYQNRCCCSTIYMKELSVHRSYPDTNPRIQLTIQIYVYVNGLTMGSCDVDLRVDSNYELAVIEAMKPVYAEVAKKYGFEVVQIAGGILELKNPV